MRTYKRINEDFLDKTDMRLDNVSVLDDARAELDDWIHYGKEPSFNPEILPDSFYPVNKKLELNKLIQKARKLNGLNCSLNWIDVSRITDMSWLFYQSLFNGDISRWDVSSVKNMQGMFYFSEFNGDISGWNVSSVESMQSMFYHSEFNGDISGWKVSNVYNISNMFKDSHFCQDISSWTLRASHTRYVDTFENCPIPDNYKPTVLPG